MLQKHDNFLAKSDEQKGYIFNGLKLAVIIPCFNEELSIAKIVKDFKATLPEAFIYVFDNNSIDDTALKAAQAGAIVLKENRKGKGHVVRRMFADIDADIYVMIDGDGTYNPEDSAMLINTLLTEKVDMVIGTRKDVTLDAGREGHAFGNKLFNKLYGRMFGKDFTDIFSGYRVFSRRFVKSFPALSNGFEIETEMSVHASQLRIPTTEISLDYGRRGEGSHSKLSTFKDGFKILMTLILLLKEVRPFTFFGLIGLIFAMASIGLAIPLFIEYFHSGLVTRLPTAILVTGMMLIASLSLAIGIVLNSVSRKSLENKRLQYLSYQRFLSPLR